MAETVKCAFCDKEIKFVNACIGFGIEKPISESHYFCSEEHRSEFVINATAVEKGLSSYTIRNYINNGRKVNYGEEMSKEDWEAMKKGEILTCMCDGEPLMRWILNPFDELKEF